MTACDGLRLELAAYVDDELGVDAAIAIERHLAQCRGCRRELVRQRQLQRALRALHPMEAAPAGLEERTRAAVIGPAPRRTGAAIAIAAAIAVVAGAWAAMRAPDGAHEASSIEAALAAPPAAVVAAADAHRRLAADGVTLDVATADVGEVNRWLVRRLPFVATVPAPEGADVVVEGASVVRLAERPAGLVRYRVRGHEVSLFLLPRPVWDAAEPAVRVRNVEFRVFRRDGLALVGWSHAPLSYLLVSEGGLGAGDACATCHVGGERATIQEFVTAVAGGAAGA